LEKVNALNRRQPPSAALFFGDNAGSVFGEETGGPPNYYSERKISWQNNLDSGSKLPISINLLSALSNNILVETVLFLYVDYSALHG